MAEYYLDLVTMVEVLQSLGQTGQIEANLPATSQRGLGSIQPSHLTLGIKDGRILFCVLQDVNGKHILSDNQDDIRTLSKLYSMRITWKFTQTELPAPNTSGSLSQFSPARDSDGPGRSREVALTPTNLSQPDFTLKPSQRRAYTPRRIHTLPTEYLASMPRQYRMIYALIDGMNSVERITQLMPALSPDTIQTILYELQSRGIIIL